MAERKRLRSGRMVNRPPDLSILQKQLDGLQPLIDEVFAEIKQAREREAALAQTTTSDPTRFPVLEKGQRNG